MRIIQFDCVGGASGDMLLATLIDLGADIVKLSSTLATLKVGKFELKARRTVADGLRGVRVDVRLPAPHHGHPHRGLKDIVSLIRRSGLPAAVKAQSCIVFNRLAVAEARVHGTTPNRIHFHEVGAVDSIVDICGACLALHQLSVDAIMVNPLPLGHGTIRCAHGILPSPSPATVELLKGSAVVAVDEPHELVTPTGAALLTTWRSAESLPGGYTLTGCGIGIGHRRLETRPNIARAFLFEAVAGTASGQDECVVLECNLDDMTPQLVGDLTRRLLEQGALDVFTTAVQMKKQRPGILLTALCRPAQRAKLIHLLFTASTTFGIREHIAQRTILVRRMIPVQTPYGMVQIKVGEWRGRIVTRTPEYEDCLVCADRRGVPVKVVYAAAQAAALAIR